MSRRLFALLLCIAPLLPAAVARADTGGLRVDERATYARLDDNAIRVMLALRSGAASRFAARIHLELLDLTDTTCAEVERTATVAPGASVATIALAWTGAAESIDLKRLLEYRVRYRAVPEIGSTPAAEGIVALSRLAHDIFDLTAEMPPDVRSGERYESQVFATHPTTHLPIADVALSATLHLTSKNDDVDDLDLVASGRTDRAGCATLGFSVPKGFRIDDGRIEVTGRRGSFVATAEDDLSRPVPRARLMVTTDKGLYQPGQMLHVRCLAFDDSSTRPAALFGAPLTVTVSAEGYDKVFRTTATTTRFGVASVEWQIPANAKLGSYMIQVDLDGDDLPNGIAGAWFSISRYDLPTFAVTTAPDRPYYLPGQNAAVEVRADYLFGKPVPGGRVRVVREQSREWNYRQQKWEIDEGQAVEGTAGPDGRFTARLDLGAIHEEIAEEDYEHYRDVPCAAYVTDPTTNRTEQRRFDLRVTRDAIHLYAITPDRLAKGFLNELFVTASYADGTPAKCDVRVSVSDGDADDRTAGHTIATARTNRHGVARIEGVRLDESIDDRGRDDLVVEARDASGRTGRDTQSIWIREEPGIRVETDRAIYRPGQPIRARVVSSATGSASVSIMQNGHVLESRAVRLDDGVGTISFPYRPAFAGGLQVAAFLPRRGEYGYYQCTSVRGVLYPRDEELAVTVSGMRDTYQPGESVQAELRLRDTDGNPVEGALGVVVVDKAVDERERTEAEFGSQGGFYNSYDDFLGYDAQVGGVTTRALYRLDPNRAVPDDLDLTARVVLFAGLSYEPDAAASDRQEIDYRRAFAPLLDPIGRRIRSALLPSTETPSAPPRDVAALRAQLAASGFRFDEEARDPWGEPLTPIFSIDGAMSVVELMSAGPDETVGTEDDFSTERISRPYLIETGTAINRAIAAYHRRTGGYVRDEATLSRALADGGVPTGALRDPQGRRLRPVFETNGRFYTVAFVSDGSTRDLYDDVRMWTSQTDSFADTRDSLDTALNDMTRVPFFPRDEAGLRVAFELARIDPASIRDLWGRECTYRFETQFKPGAPVSARSVTTFGRPDTRRIEYQDSIPILVIRSAGPDGVPGTSDDLTLGTIVPSDTPRSQGANPAPAGVGTLTGTVSDVSGAVVPDASVKVKLPAVGLDLATRTDEAGRYVIENAPTGFYDVQIDASGFKTAVVLSVLVSPSTATVCDVTLEAGSVSETVTVTAGAEGIQVDTTSTSVATTVETRQVAELPLRGRVSTPRVRQYFPETLLWQPLVETDAQGRAKLDFALADSITTWRLAVIASSADGRIGRATTSLVAFQPFFVEHDPPKVLTEGDRVSLPVVLRNYLDEPQDVTVEARPETWLAIDGPARRDVRLTPGESGLATFAFRAAAPVDEGANRVTATGARASDAVEKPVTIHPEGEEIVKTATRVGVEPISFDVDVPDDTLSMPRGELKLYPSLLSHVVDAVDAILERPYGCGEQTVSSTYPSVLLLRHAAGRMDPKLEQTARRYARIGTERLLTYRSDDGGFSYWGNGNSDFALTAYALRFLTDAHALGLVDEEVIDDASAFLIKAQTANGTWPDGNSLSTTAYVAQALAASGSTGDGAKALRRALDTLALTTDDSYVVACYALAAYDAGDPDAAARAVARLQTMAREGGGGAFWSSTGETAFHGWGRPGAIETTALAVRALDRAAGDARARELADRGVSYLLRNKDRYGIWYSTQATINVLDALLEAAERRDDGATNGPLEVFVGGAQAATVVMQTSKTVGGSVAVDLTPYLVRGANHVEVRRGGRTATGAAHLVTSYYAPWPAEAASREGRAALDRNGLRLSVAYDRTDAVVGESITCTVEAARTTSTGYGMLLGEIGIPPGAEVDRESLVRAATESGWALSRYDLLPDRVVVYLWPRQGVSRFSFSFRPRYGISALASPSSVYDYYNPDARVALAPPRFEVRESR